MLRIFIAFICCFVCAPVSLWAAESGEGAHVFEFDYDNQIEAPVLNVPPQASESGTLDLLFMPTEAAAPPAPSGEVEISAEEVKTVAEEAKVPAPGAGIAAAIEKAAPQGAAPRSVARKKEAGPPPAKARVSTRASATAAPPALLPALRADDSFYRLDSRHRFWFLATRTWELAGRQSLPRITQVQAPDLKEFPTDKGEIQ